MPYWHIDNNFRTGWKTMNQETRVGSKKSLIIYRILPSDEEYLVPHSAATELSLLPIILSLNVLFSHYVLLNYSWLNYNQIICVGMEITIIAALSKTGVI